MLIFLLIFLTILIGRHNTFLIGYEILNIDESQMMANAIRLEKMVIIFSNSTEQAQGF